MKIRFYVWAGGREARRILEGMNYKHLGYYDVEDPFALAKTLHECGLNVMLPQPHDGVQSVCVDYKHLFTQR